MIFSLIFIGLLFTHICEARWTRYLVCESLQIILVKSCLSAKEEIQAARELRGVWRALKSQMSFLKLSLKGLPAQSGQQKPGREVLKSWNPVFSFKPDPIYSVYSQFLFLLPVFVMSAKWVHLSFWLWTLKNYVQTSHYRKKETTYLSIFKGIEVSLMATMTPPWSR